MGKINLRALILDYGGVISQPQNPANVSNILQTLKQDVNGFSEVYFSQRGQYDCAQLSGEQYWRDILLHYGLDPLGFELAGLIEEDVKSWTHLNEAMIQYITATRGKISKLAMLSNMTHDTLAYMRRHFGWLDLFDETCFSCELGIKKPEAGIYAACLSKLELAPQECLFVDDSARNVKGAQEAGLPAMHFTTFAEFKLELDEKYSFTG